jgi:hypothetical protein
MNNNKLEQLKKIYHAQTLPEETIEELWQNLASRLPSRQYHPYHHVMRFAFLTLFIMFLTLGSVVGMAQAAKPNTPLYPVKILADRIVAKATKTYHVTIKKRATEVIDSAQSKSVKDLQQSTKAYTETLSDVKTDEKTSDSSKKELRNTLEHAKEDLEHITPANSASQNLIEHSIKETEKVKEEVKGANTGNNQNNNSDNNAEMKKENAESKGNNSNNSNQEKEHGNQENSGKN